MKLLSFSIHCNNINNLETQLEQFVEAILIEKPQVIALQEVKQNCDKMNINKACGYISCDNAVMIKEDNFIYKAVEILKSKGIQYYWTWLPTKSVYGAYEEGIGFMSVSPILETSTKSVGNTEKKENARKIVGVRIAEYKDEWFFCIHYGLDNDKKSSFIRKWKDTDSYLQKYDKAWIMGDLNSPNWVRNKGYDTICYYGWKDSFILAGKAENITFKNGISNQIWFKHKKIINSLKYVFNGDNYPFIAEQPGVMIDCEIIA